jgi:hypothetical protein
LSNDSNNLKTVLICGDSFGVTDSDYPDLHFSEKISKSTPAVFELYNLSHGGDSNALIALQLMQGLQFNPNFVILLFTTPHRHEIDNDIDAHCSTEVNLPALNAFRHDRYTTSCYVDSGSNQDKLIKTWNSEIISDDFEILKNYFLINYCLQLLEKTNIPFCYSIGGMANTNYLSIINKNFIKNYFNEYADKSLKINLWNHNSNKSRPYFHVDNNNVQSAFANECIHHLKNNKII